MHVRTGLAFESQGFLEIEGDDRGPRETQHEIAQRANGNLRGDLLAFVVRQLFMPAADFLQGAGDQHVKQIVRLNA